MDVLMFQYKNDRPQWDGQVGNASEKKSVSWQTLITTDVKKNLLPELWDSIEILNILLNWTFWEAISPYFFYIQN